MYILLKRLFCLFVSLIEPFIAFIVITSFTFIKKLSLGVSISLFSIILSATVNIYKLIFLTTIFLPIVYLFDFVGLVFLYLFIAPVYITSRILDDTFIPILNLAINLCSWIYTKCKQAIRKQEPTQPTQKPTRVKLDIEKLKIDLQRLKYKERGKAIIFNQFEFSKNRNLTKREGTFLDKNSMADVLDSLNYGVHSFDDMSKSEIETIIKEVSKLDHTHCDSLVVVILSHGDRDGVYAFHSKYTLKTIFDCITCPSLDKKPKIFFVQACQGRKRDSGTALENVPIVIAGKQNPENLPTTPDFFVARSSYQGLVSYRDEGSGSFFIQILAEKLKKGMDLHSALTLVMDHIARKLSFDEGFKQMPTIVSTLSDTFKF